MRELWYRASLALQSILVSDDSETTPERPLIVAHNAVNQALLCVSMGLPASYFRYGRKTKRNIEKACRGNVFESLSFWFFSPLPGRPRRFVQSNGGISCLDFIPDRPLPVIDRLNQSPDSPLSARLTCPRLILIRAGATELSENGVLMGMIDEPLSQVGAKQAVSGVRRGNPVHVS